ncbi:MAG: gluconate transporter [Chitinophagaceae bacterium]|nr:gluconate transporter [Chitinophagaceae bacterium]
MPLVLILFIVVGVLILLTTSFKVSPFIALILVSLLAGFLLGIPLAGIAKSVQKGIGDMLGSILVILSAGAMIGKLVAESGAAKVIADKIMQVCGEKYLQWGLMLTGLVIGIPLFYNVGFVLVIPIIFSLVYQYKLPAVYVAIPMLASLSVAHSFLPPHPSPASLVVTFNASMGKTFFYGLIVAIPSIVLAGPVFSRTLKKIKTPGPIVVVSKNEFDQPLPGFRNSLLSAMLPVFLLGITTLLSFLFAAQPSLLQVTSFLNEPSVLMVLALLIVTYTLGIKQGKSIKQIMQVYENGIKDIAMIILIIGASGALKQVLIDSNASNAIAEYFKYLHIHPLLLGWLIAAIIRLCLGSATVAGLTTAGIIAPMMGSMQVDANLMILAIGSGSVFFSHVNDTGFWMFKEYFNVSLKDTFLSWSLMETIVSVTGLIGVFLLNLLL